MFALGSLRSATSRLQHYQLLPTSDHSTPHQSHAAPSIRHDPADRRRWTWPIVFIAFHSRRAVDSVYHFRPRTRQQLVVCALIGVVIVALFLEVLHAATHRANSWEYRPPPPLIVTCPSVRISDSDSEGPQHSPSADLLRWQRPWRDDAFCSLQRTSAADGFEAVEHDNGRASTYEKFHLADDTGSRLQSLEIAVHAIQPVTSVPAECLDNYLALGLPCPCIPTSPPFSNETQPSLPTPKTIDVLWTWVNGSDPLHRKELDATRTTYGLPPTSPKLFRDHDELRYSLRSVLHSMRSVTNRLHILAADMPSPISPSSLAATNPHTQRLGQLPSWLNTSSPASEYQSSTSTTNYAWHDGNATLSMRYHSQAFRPELLNGPTFNSFAIEAQLGNQCNVSENFVYMNDDFFITRDVEAGDFYTPYYGPVIRFDYSLPIWPHDPSEGAPDGEWRPLERSSYMLSLRFGYRGRPYTAHAPKLLSSPLLHEMSAGMWRGSFGETAGRPFRGLNPNPLDEDDRRRGEMGRKGGDDVHPGYIFGNFVVERWREALLWSWVVARIGGTGTPEGWVPPIEPSDAEEDDEEEEDGDDFWDHARRDDAADPEDFWDDDLHGHRAWSEIGGDDDTADLEITLTQRNTLDLRLVDHNLGRTGSDRLGTAYTFSSLDGYPFSFINPNKPGSPPALTPFPMLWQRWWFADRFSDERAASARPYNVSCPISRTKCFPRGSARGRASDVFRHVAFERSECGDCIIEALVSASGQLGLSAFLPSPDRIFAPPPTEAASMPSPAAELPPPHLSLADDFHDADFRLRSSLDLWARESTNPDGISVREWTLQLLQRYRFVAGDTRVQFHMLTDKKTTKKALKNVESDKSVAMVCLNDDVIRDQGSVDKTLTAWLRKKWPRPATWER